MRKDHLRVRVCSTLVLLSLFLSGPVSVLGNWGLEVGRANTTDVANLAKDWNTYRRNRVVLDWEGRTVLRFERQRQLLGGEFVENLSPAELFLKTEDAFLTKIMGPLQRIAMNPASSCPESQFALVEMIGFRRQQQLLGLEESETINSVYEATEEMVSLRCRNEALDECVATGRFMQILELMVTGDRQTQILGREGSLESWAEDALKQCAIYELHFVSTTKDSQDTPIGPFKVETVRDGKIQIRFEIPPGGLKAARRSLGDALKGETAGGNNPFFVSVKCTFQTPRFTMSCSPGADSQPIKVRINALDLKHREFYLDTATSEYSLGGFLKERLVGEDKLSFEFEGGEFSLQGVIKAEDDTFDWPMPYMGSTFYHVHEKDQMDGESYRLKIEKSIKRGVHPTILQFTYADQVNFIALITDSTEFELIHKPKPKPFRKLPDPIRRPLRPRPGE